MHTDASDITLNVCLGKVSYTPLLDPYTSPHTPSHTLTHPHTPSHTLTHSIYPHISPQVRGVMLHGR